MELSDLLRKVRARTCKSMRRKLRKMPTSAKERIKKVRKTDPNRHFPG